MSGGENGGDGRDGAGGFSSPGGGGSGLAITSIPISSYFLRLIFIKSIAKQGSSKIVPDFRGLPYMTSAVGGGKGCPQKVDERNKIG